MSWTLPETDHELLSLAKGYPFRAHPGSYLYQDGEAHPLEGFSAALYEGRVPVIAHGSNRSPDQLRRKFDYLSGAASAIPVTRAQLMDHDVVYSAHVTQYGSMAANLQYLPGVEVEIFVTWLTPLQLQRMHDTELGGENYAYGQMRDIRLEVESGHHDTLTEVCVYLSTHGCLSRNEAGNGERAPIGLAAVPARNRPHGSLDQLEALTLVRDSYRPEQPLDDHILTTIREPQLRQALVAELRETAIPAAAPHFSVLELP